MVGERRFKLGKDGVAAAKRSDFQERALSFVDCRRFLSLSLLNKDPEGGSADRSQQKLPHESKHA